MNKIVIILLFLSVLGCKEKVTQEVQTSLAKRGTFSEELTEEGTLRAVNSISINAPAISYRFGGLKINSIIADGKEVEKGDTVVVLDPSEVKKAIIDSEQRLAIAQAEYDKLKAIQQSEIEDLDADLEITRISQEISRINFEQSVYESEVTKKEINLKLESANIALSRSKEQLENKKKIHQEDLFQKTLSMKQLQTTLDDANSSMKSLFVVTPAPGIAIVEQNWMTQQKWQAGDQPYSGTKLIELPDLNEMMAEVEINEVDIAKLTPDLKVIIKPDAYTDTTYNGRVSTIATLAQNKNNESKIKIFPVTIKIDGTKGNLMPGLTVSCKIIINEIPDVVYIPLEAVFKDQGNEFVWMKSGSGFKRVDIKIGAINTDYALVSEGLSENDEIALGDPFLNKEESKKSENSNK